MTRTFVACMVILGLGGVAAADEGKLHVAYANGKLSVHAEGVPVPEVLAEVARVAGGKVSGLVEDPHAITTDFTDVPTDAALERLLGDQPFATRYRGDRLVSIRLVDRGRGGEPVIVYPTPARAPNLDHPPLIALSRTLASRVGAPRATLTRVATTAMGDPDASIRRDAAAAIVLATNADPAVREELVASYGRMSEQALIQLAQGMPGATEFFQYIAAHSQSDELRDKAQNILRLLGTPAGAQPAADQG